MLVMNGLKKRGERKREREREIGKKMGDYKEGVNRGRGYWTVLEERG